MRIKQVIGRAIRQCSHQDLPINERHVKIFNYYLTRENEKNTTDETINEIASRKYKLNETFLFAMQESAIDCELFKEVNSKGDETYNCFKFDDESLLSGDVGYAFRKDIYDDFKKENKGSNSVNYETIRIKVKKIKAIKKDQTLINEYWFDENTGNVYDLDVNILIGRVNKDATGLPEMKDTTTYIISHLTRVNNFILR